MNTNAKAFIVTGGAAYLASRFVFDNTQRKSVLYAFAAGLAIVALLQIKVTTNLNKSGQGKQTSPQLPETDNTKGNLNPETLPPIVFSTGAPLTNSVLSTLEPV